MKNTCLLFLLLFADVCTCAAQQVFTLPVIRLTSMGFNPALNGQLHKWSASAQNSSSDQFRYSLFQAEGYSTKIQAGAGILMESYQTSLESQQAVRLNLSYRLPTGSGYVQFGLAPILRSYRLNQTNLTIRNAEDPLAPSSTNSLLQTDMAVGAIYKTDQLLVSASIQNLIQGKHFQNGLFLQKRIYSGLVSYELPITADWKYVPALYAQNIPNEAGVVSLSNQLAYKSLFIAVQVGAPGSWLAGTGVTLHASNQASQLQVGYTIANERNWLWPSYQHTVFLHIGWGKATKKTPDLHQLPRYHSPVYF